MALRSHRILLGCFLIVGLLGCGDQKQESQKDPAFEGGTEKTYERGPLKVVLRLDNSTPSIADKITLQMEIISEEDYEITPPAFGEKLEQFGIVDFRSTPAELVGGGKLRQVRSYILEPFLSGDYVIPSMTFQFRKRDGSEDKDHKLETEELKVKVSSLLSEDAENLHIHEIEPPVELPKPERNFFWPIAAALSALALTGAGFFFFKRRTVKEATAVRIPAHELAFASLEKLVAEDLPDQGELKKFYQKISDILRRYIENRFGLHAPEQTTEEFLSELRTGSQLEPGHQTLLSDFLTHCDLVKFAEHQPDQDDIQKTFDSCKNFIMETQEAST